MTLRLILPLCFLTLPFLGCSKASDSESSLTAAVGPEAPYVIPVPLRSCKAIATAATSTDVSANTMEFTRFQYQWVGTGTFTMSAIFIRFKSGFLNGGKYECNIAGDELAYILPSGGRILQPGDSGLLESTCTIKCGGIKVNEGVNSAYIPGTLKIVGIETDTDGNSRPVTAEVSVGMTYDKF